ncbi:hypothetical protein F4777DRAFT_491249 [Nemania sp. FL0916]|nr:hypothetical protein F4777DRAFT_491249 [Nemania sp. FL0916]
MQTPRISTLSTTLFNLLILSPLPVVSIISGWSICVRENAPMLAYSAACGDPNSLRAHLESAPNFVTFSDLREGFIDAGCTIAEATTEIMVIFTICDVRSSKPELRRRSPEGTPAVTPTPAPLENAEKPESTSPVSVMATSQTNMPRECSTARVIKTTVCQITSMGKDDFSTLPCTSTTFTSAECAATNICSDDGTCKFRPQGISLSGLVVAILFGATVVISIAVLVFYYAWERKLRRLAREKAEKEAQEKRDKEAEAARRDLAKQRVLKERLRRQQMEAEDWAKRHGAESPRGPVSPLRDDRWS